MARFEAKNPDYRAAAIHTFAQQRAMETLGVTIARLELGEVDLAMDYSPEYTQQHGFIHAGNLAYLSLLTLFPFFVVAAALAQLFGRTEVGLNAVETFLQSVPPEVARVLKEPIEAALGARSGRALWIGALVCLWSTTSFVETIRDILRRAYGVRMIRPFWHYRLFSIATIIGSLLLVLLAFSLQVTLVAAEQFMSRVLPFAADARLILSVTRLAPPLALFGALYALFYTLTPPQYRDSRAPKWPGANPPGTKAAIASR